MKLKNFLCILVAASIQSLLVINTMYLPFYVILSGYING